MEEEDDEVLDTRPLMSFDNFVNNQPSNLQQPRSNNGAGSTAPVRYIGEVMFGSFPKMLIIVSA